MSWRDVPFPISHLTPVAGRLPLKREISTHWQAGCFFSNVWLYYIYVWQGSRWCRGTRVGEQMLVSGNSNVGVGEQQCWCRGTCMLVSADEHSCQATSTLRTFCTSRTLCTLRTVYALFACFLRTLSSLGTLCTVRTLTWRACRDAFFDALFTHFLRTFYALLVHFLRTLRNLRSLLALYTLITQFLRTFYALCALYTV